MSVFKRYAIIYHQQFGFNVLPIRGKKPTILWDKWQSEKQVEDDIEKMEWTNSTGVGVSLGLDDLRLLDIDAVEDYEILDKLLEDLELPNKYPWVVQSGSGEGFHISIRSPSPTLPEGKGVLDRLGGDKAVYKLQMKEKGFCKHIELRWKNCQTVFPPSRHESGGVYSFYYEEPKELPVYVDAEKLITVLEKYCVLERETSKVKGERKEEKTRQKDAGQAEGRMDEKITYDKERLENALGYLSEHLPSGSYEEWYRIGFALVTLGAEGEKYFVEMSMKNPNYQDSEAEIRKKFADLVKEYDGRVTLGTIYHLAEIYGWKKPIIKFWNAEEAGKVKISRMRFKRFLESEGFCKYKLDPANGMGSNYLFVRIVNNIVEEIDTIDEKEFVMGYLEQVPIEEFEGASKTEIMDALIKNNNQLFTEQFLEFLITRDIVFNKETSNEGYFYFRNGFVKVSKNDVKSNDYKTLNRNIWRKQIINRNYSRSMKRSIFEEFLNNIVRNKGDRYRALKSAIGYLLHTYKDPSNAKAIVFIDEKLTEGAFGRCGKGLVIRSISHVRNVITEDGRNFNPAKNFAFQRVKADTNILSIDDIKEKFPFERFFSIITDGITIERKNKDEIYLPYSESPKIAVTTNFSISGIDDSSLDRQFIVEFSDHYNKRHKPVDDFGKLFFASWDADEWCDFDNFMIECLQFYLKEGLVSYQYINLDRKKLIDETSTEFAEFSDELKLDREYDKKELYEDFKKEYQDYDKLTQRKFTHWLKIFGRLKDYEVKEGKSGAKRTIEFVKTEEMKKDEKEAA